VRLQGVRHQGTGQDEYFLPLGAGGTPPPVEEVAPRTWNKGPLRAEHGKPAQWKVPLNRRFKTRQIVDGRKMALINLILAFYTAKYLLEITDHVIYLKHFEKNV
jgi:hypothetical protein